jgi:hypothetical protein
MVLKRKVSLGSEPAKKGPAGPARATSEEVLELFFNTGVVFHEVTLAGELPDLVSGFVLMKGAPAPRAGETTVRRAQAGEEPDIEISALEHMSELRGRWLPVPYQLSAPHVVQVYLGGDDPRAPRVLLAIDTLERLSAGGRHLDASLDEGRPFRALDKNECTTFLDHPETRELVRKMERVGIDRATFKLAALLETLGLVLPRLRFSRVESKPAISVSLILDLGNSRSTAALVESRDKGLFSIPLEIRNSLNPFEVNQETFDSRVTFLAPPFDKAAHPVATGDSFSLPSIVRMGREALDRALETPHRYACTLSGPKRYLWDARPTDERWHFANRSAADGEYTPIFGRILKHLTDDGGGIVLRADGPSTPADPRYAPRTMMLFAIVEILSQAVSQINSASYRAFQGKEQNPRILKSVVLTYPSAMRHEEKAVYEALVQNAVLLVCHVLNIKEEHRPNWVPDPEAQGAAKANAGHFEPFLFVDEALAAQMVYVYQEIAENFAGSMEELVQVYGRSKTKLRVASIDIGGGTSDVMIAEYEDKLPGTGTSLAITKLFQDGINIAGDEVCRAILEDIVFVQLLTQLPSPAARTQIVHLFGEGDAGHGAPWRTLKAKLVPYFWLPLARCYWAMAEGFEIKDHTSDKLYSIADIFRVFETVAWSEQVIREADRFLGSIVKDFPGIQNLFFRFDREEVERTIESVLREPLRKYADVLAQFDIDLVVLAGRTSALKCIHELFVAELPVASPRIRRMANYRVGDWYPSKWREAGLIKDPKSTVTAGATVLHMASKNRLSGFLLDHVQEARLSPIYGLYQEVEPHISRTNELFTSRRATPPATGPKGVLSPPFAFTNGMIIGFRNVDSPEMDASPLFEVVPRNADVERALLEDRVSLTFALAANGELGVHEVTSQRGVYSFSPDDFALSLKTLTSDRYWLDTGVFKNILKYV